MAAQVLALGAAIALAAFPVRAFLLSPDAPLAAKLAWAALALAAVARPMVRAPLLILLTPFLPWLPFAVKGVPRGVVPPARAEPGDSVARPARVRSPRRASRCDWPAVAPVPADGSLQRRALLCRVRVALRRSHALPGGRRGAARPLRADPPSIEIVSLVAACAALGDAVLAWLIVRTSPHSTMRLVRLAAITAVGVACVGIWQAFTGVGLRPDWRVNDPYITRINATFSDPNALAAYLAA